MKLYKDKLYNFVEIFNEKNGLLIRTNILNEKGDETAIEPKMRSFPELIDIGIMGKCHVNQMFCKKFGVDCYQADNNYDDMLFDDYKKIIDQCKGKTFQVALGGRGDPNKHKNFIDILEYTHKKGIVPNLTTTGFNLTDNEIMAIKKYCGAVAISMYSRVNIKDGNIVESNPESILAINKLVSHNITTNIHYVISKETIDNLIFRLKHNLFPNGINAIVFLLYKPVGMASYDKMISKSDKKFQEFIKILNSKKFNFKIGFDTCFSPIIVDSIKNISINSIDFCEAARYSCYISPDLTIYPCSFIQRPIYGIELKKSSIENAWFSSEFNKFRNENKCKFRGCCPCGLNECSFLENKVKNI